MMKNKTYLKSLGVGGIGLLCLCLTSLAGPTLQNADFSAGLSNWTVEYGTVTDGGGFALFEEDLFDLSSTLSQVFTIPTLALELSFDVVMASVPGEEHETWPDAFTASLLDPGTLDPLIFNPGYTEFYYLDNLGNEVTVASVMGNKVMLDVSGLAGQDVFLSFDLWGGLDGMQTTVGIDNVNVSVIPAPGALLLALIGTGLLGIIGRWRVGKLI
jgi:hypothetical protein